MYEKTLSRDFIENSVHTLRKRIYRIHPETALHCDRVADLALMIADKSGLPDQDLFNLYNASLIHDVGKTTPEFIPLLHKKGDLSQKDNDIIVAHAEGGAKLARREGLDDIAEIIRQHHERADGLGYYHVKNVLPTASILTYADCYDAMTENGRDYRLPFGPGQALRQISSEVGTQFNPQFFPVFEQVLRSQLFFDF